MTTARKPRRNGKGKEMLLVDYFEDIYRPRRLRGRAETVITQYRRLIRHLGDILERPPLVSDLDEGTICKYLDWLTVTPIWRFNPKLRAPRTINKARDQCLALARFAVLKGLLPELPDVQALPEEVPIPKCYTVKEVGWILQACETLTGHLWADGGIPKALYWKCIVLVLYDTGVRSGALWTLRCEDIDLANSSILFRAENAKTRRSQLLRVAPDTLASIKAIWEPLRELLFPWPYACQGTRYNHWDEILQRAGLPLLHGNKFKMLRKTCATLCKANGADATAQLGHSTDAMTRRHYLVPDMEIQAADVLPRPSVNGADDSPMIQTQLETCLPEYRAVLAQRPGTRRGWHNAQVLTGMIDNLNKACRFRTIGDIDGQKILRYFRTCQRKGLAPNTVRNRRAAYRKFVEWLLSNELLPNLRAAVAVLQPGGENQEPQRGFLGRLAGLFSRTRTGTAAHPPGPSPARRGLSRMRPCRGTDAPPFQDKQRTDNAQK